MDEAEIVFFGKCEWVQWAKQIKQKCESGEEGCEDMFRLRKRLG